MTPPELIAAGYNVELNYKPYIPAEELIDLQEQVRFYSRTLGVLAEGKLNHWTGTG